MIKIKGRRGHIVRVYHITSREKNQMNKLVNQQILIKANKTEMECLRLEVVA